MHTIGAAIWHGKDSRNFHELSGHHRRQLGWSHSAGTLSGRSTYWMKSPRGNRVKMIWLQMGLGMKRSDEGRSPTPGVLQRTTKCVSSEGPHANGCLTESQRSFRQRQTEHAVTHRHGLCRSRYADFCFSVLPAHPTLVAYLLRKEGTAGKGQTTPSKGLRSRLSFLFFTFEGESGQKREL